MQFCHVVTLLSRNFITIDKQRSHGKLKSKLKPSFDPAKKISLSKKTPEEEIMIKVLLSNLEDYLRALNLAGKDFEEELKRFRQKDNAIRGRGHKAAHKTTPEYKRFHILVQGEKAKNYIFSNSKDSDTPPFGFKFICCHFGFNPEKIRKKLKSATRGTLKKFFGAYFKEKGELHE